MVTVRLPFPTGKRTRNGTPQFGAPTLARSCHGHRVLLHDDTCVWCGRLPSSTIRRTWASRARQIERERV